MMTNAHQQNFVGSKIEKKFLPPIQDRKNIFASEARV